MPLSNSDVAGILRFVHKSGDNFIRQITIEDDQDPRQPVNLSGYTVVFEISTIKNVTSLFKITSSANPTRINISGASSNLIDINFLLTDIAIGRYNYTLSVVDPSQNIKTWLKGDFIIT